MIPKLILHLFYYSPLMDGKVEHRYTNFFCVVAIFDAKLLNTIRNTNRDTRTN